MYPVGNRRSYLRELLRSWHSPNLQFLWVADDPWSYASSVWTRTPMRPTNGALLLPGGLANAADGSGPYLRGALPFSLGSGSPYFIAMLVTPPAGATTFKGAFLKIGDSSTGLGFGAGNPDMDVAGSKIIALREGIAWHVGGANAFNFGTVNFLAAGTFSDSSFQAQFKNITTGGLASIISGTWTAPANDIFINGYSTRTTSGVVHAVAIYNSSFSSATWDAEAARLRAPIQSLEGRPLGYIREICRPRRIWVPVSAAGGGVDLVIADATHAHAADAPTLTTTWLLTVADATHGHAADAPTLSTEWLLAAADALHGHAADNLTLEPSGSANLAPADATHGHTADAITLTTASLLAVQDALHAHAAEAATLSTEWLLAPADATHAHAADNLTLSDAPALLIAEALHAHTADGVTMTVDAWLVLADATHGHLADNVVLFVPGGTTVREVLRLSSPLRRAVAGASTLARTVAGSSALTRTVALASDIDAESTTP